MRRASMILRNNVASAQTTPTENADEPGDYDKDPRTMMQKKTFRRWCNSYLDNRGLLVHDIIKDWEDGILLTNLLEELSQSTLPKYNKTPKLKAHRLENLNACLKFITNTAKIHLVNIGSEDLFKGNPTIVLGLIWTLILRWGLTLRDGKSGLLNWCIKQVKDQPNTPDIKNFTNSWQDGRAFCAVIAASRPDLIDMNTIDSSNPIGNMDLAFNVAKDHLEVDKLLDPQDVMNNPDEKSIVAYVGQVFTALSKPQQINNNTQSTKNDTEVTTKPIVAAVVPVAIQEPVEEEPEESPKPSAPVLSNPGTNSVQVNWEPFEKTTKTRIQCKENGKDWSDILRHEDHPSSVNQCFFKGLSPGKNYVFRVVGITSTMFKTRESEPSDEVECFTDIVGAPLQPALLEAQLDNASISWIPPNDATMVTVELKKDDESWDDAIKIDIDPNERTNTTLENLSPGTVYEARIIANGENGATPPSLPVKIVTLLPEMPAPVADNISESTAEISWDLYPNATSYIVQTRTIPKDWEDGRECEVSGPPIVVDDLLPGSENECRVIAVTPIGNSEPSKSVEVNIPMMIPQSPYVYQVNDNGLDISWDPYPGAIKYKVQVRDNDEPWEDARTEELDAPTTSTRMLELESDRDHEVRIIAITDTIETEPSFPVAVMTAPSLKIHGRIALVTGANSKKGCQTVRDMAKEGESFFSWAAGFSRIFVCSHNPSPELKQLQEEYSEKVCILHFSTTDNSSILEASRRLALEAPYIDVCVNNASMSAEVLGLLLSRTN